MDKRLRCAVYTRKSSEEGLEQGFNSLHAQREACEAYILSQRSEGWSPIKTAYDDGGFSGGNVDRPGLKALLDDVERGRIDVVVVYKVDRLTRSLCDFAKIVDAFDAKGVSFVSVTQAFNTTTSMGRLTLNVLLSFAQFEREVTGERIRDKIAASKAKGMWMGGALPLGYDAPTDLLTRALVINDAEAETVRLIFDRYLELGSVHAVADWLDSQAVRSKVRITAKGSRLGGERFSRGALFHLLKNRTYLGEIVHKDRVHPGAHTGVVDPAVFDRVQARLSSQAVTRRTQTTRVATMILKGRLFDADGDPMSPTFVRGSAARGSADRLYRYYVSAPLQQGGRRPADDEAVRRVQADAVEALVKDCLLRLSSTQRAATKGDPLVALARVEVHPTSVQLLVRRAALFRTASDPETELAILRSKLGPNERLIQEGADPALARVVLPRRLKFQGGRTWIADADGAPLHDAVDPDLTLIKGLRLAHEHLARSGGVAIGQLERLNLESAPTSPYDRNLCRLAFLAPDIQALILEGRQPAGLTLTGLLTGDLPASWEDQRRVFGIADKPSACVRKVRRIPRKPTRRKADVEEGPRI